MKKSFQPFLKLLVIGLVATKITASFCLLSSFSFDAALFHIQQLAYAEDQKPEDLKKTDEQKQHGKTEEKSEDSKKPDEHKQHGKTEEKPPSETAAPEPEKKDETTAETKVILKSLEKKRLFLQQEEIRIGEERKQIEVLKEEMEENLQNLSKVQKQIEEKLILIEKKETEKERQKREAKEKKLKQLLKIYTSMKPKDVGSIINKLEFEDALTIFLMMKGEQAAKILTYVNTELAVKISEQLINEKNRIQAK
jgi:flagellar motility protein MotE (MotC chaperone)